MNNLNLENLSAIGSDEVGTGDFFGPITVCSTYVSRKHFDYLNSLGLKDSKKLTDKKICEIASKLIKVIPYSLLVLDNAKYNQIIKKINMNAIKAKMHNRVLLNLLSKINEEPDIIIVDQFASEKNYFNYLKGEKDIITNIAFYHRAESLHMSVAAASIIARFAFLKKFDELSNKTDYTLLKGASNKVLELTSKIISEKGEDYLYSIAKLNFKTVEKAKLKL